MQQFIVVIGINMSCVWDLDEMNSPQVSMWLGNHRRNPTSPVLKIGGFMGKSWNYNLEPPQPWSWAVAGCHRSHRGGTGRCNACCAPGHEVSQEVFRDMVQRRFKHVEALHIVILPNLSRKKPPKASISWAGGPREMIMNAFPSGSSYSFSPTI